MAFMSFVLLWFFPVKRKFYETYDIFNQLQTTIEIKNTDLREMIYSQYLKNRKTVKKRERVIVFPFVKKFIFTVLFFIFMTQVLSLIVFDTVSFSNKTDIYKQLYSLKKRMKLNQKIGENYYSYIDLDVYKEIENELEKIGTQPELNKSKSNVDYYEYIKEYLENLNPENKEKIGEPNPENKLATKKYSQNDELESDSNSNADKSDANIYQKIQDIMDQFAKQGDEQDRNSAIKNYSTNSSAGNEGLAGKLLKDSPIKDYKTVTDYLSLDFQSKNFKKSGFLSNYKKLVLIDLLFNSFNISNSEINYTDQDILSLFNKYKEIIGDLYFTE